MAMLTSLVAKPGGVTTLSKRSFAWLRDYFTHFSSDNLSYHRLAGFNGRTWDNFYSLRYGATSRHG